MDGAQHWKCNGKENVIIPHSSYSPIYFARWMNIPFTIAFVQYKHAAMLHSARYRRL
jgi:hypothetical protein